MARTLRSLTAATALLGVALIGASGTASAAEVAHNKKTQELTNRPTSGMPTSCVERDIDLAAGTYDWLQSGGLGERRDLFLGRGTYHWKDCLHPKNGHYLHRTSLDPRNPQWETIRLEAKWKPSVPGPWQWGSELDPHF
ncbi:hypothetical protein ACMA1D_25580 [Streptomyces sp. 796.1]|uniref:hypothetical protein n=1 Tax=Streptomyces sp. 796.1 TaxID=3163029 RepID=UPI0039C907F9